MVTILIPLLVQVSPDTAATWAPTAITGAMFLVNVGIVLERFRSHGRELKEHKDKLEEHGAKLEKHETKFAVIETELKHKAAARGAGS